MSDIRNYILGNANRHSADVKTEKRISRADYLKIIEAGKDKYSDLTDTEIINLAREFLLIIINLGNGSLRGSELGIVSAKLETIKGIKNYIPYFEEVSNKERMLILGSIANMLIYAIAFLDGNLPPNHLGYIGDETVSLVRKDEIVMGTLEHAKNTINAYQKSLEEVSPTIIKAYNSVLNYIENRRPTFVGELVRPDYNFKALYINE